MQIIDGYCNEPNIYADDIGEYNIALWGSGDYVLPAGEQLSYELVSNNEVKIKDGVFVMQGRRGVIKKGTTESCVIENGTQAENRNDLIVIEYAKDPFTLVESHTLKVIQGTPGESAVDPDVVTGDIQAGDVLHQMPLYRVKLEGLNVVAVEQMFTVGNVEQPEMMKKINAQNEKLEKMNANMSGLTFGQNENGKWGFKVGGADPVIPFKTGEDILPSFIRHQNYVIPSRRFLLELVGYRDMYSRSSGINRYELNGADVEQEIGKYFYCICSSGHSCNSGNVGVLKLICRGTPGNAINPVVYFNESSGATGDKARMINWIVTLTPLMEE